MTPRARVVAEAMTWLGTPYHHHGRVKGVGVDCAMLLAEVFERCGVVPHIDAGDYPSQWHLHGREERFLAWLDKVGALAVAEPQPGDVCVYRYGRTYSHGGIVVDGGLVLHAYIDQGVVLNRECEAPLLGRPRRAYTLDLGVLA